MIKRLLVITGIIGVLATLAILQYDITINLPFGETITAVKLITIILLCVVISLGVTLFFGFIDCR
jgi:hypothetical protein